MRNDEPTLREQAATAIEHLNHWHAQLLRYWSDGAPGWAPEKATEILVRSRLDRQASLCACLDTWLEVPDEARRADGHLILAWTNLGALVEGTLKLMLSIFAYDYAKSPIVRRGTAVDPDELSFEELRQFFARVFWLPNEGSWDPWLLTIQQRRNAVHAYRERDIGTHSEFLAAVVAFEELSQRLDGRIPYGQ